MASTKYTAETLQEVLKTINDGTLSVYKAFKIYNIPSKTLCDKTLFLLTEQFQIV